MSPARRRESRQTRPTTVVSQPVLIAHVRFHTLVITDTVERADRLTITATGTVDRYAHGITGAKGFAHRHLETTITAVTKTSN